MAKSIPAPPIRTTPKGRYSLRTLFLISGLIALPFLLMANALHQARPDDSIASPLYLALGVGGVVLAAAIGSALGSRAGMLTCAGLAAVGWIALVLVCSEFSQKLASVLPVHVLAAAVTVVVLAFVVRTPKESSEEGPHGMLVKLLKVKRDVQDAGQAQGSLENPDESDSNAAKDKPGPAG
ncbi:MAG TPA: hypothetical protein VFV87_06515 [Pirellulaceae bacterium]|nr:hypothetical protein [Pirellulaceae bacterium]